MTHSATIGRPQAWPSLAKFTLLALAYALMAKVSISYFSGNGAGSVFWPPAGMALALVLLEGPSGAVPVFLGSLLWLAIDRPFGYWGCMGIASANAAGALLARALVHSDGQFSAKLERLSDYFRLVVLGGMVGSAFGAFAGVMVFWFNGAVVADQFGMRLMHWWMGDTLGVVLLTPLILVWRERRSPPWNSHQAVESVMLVLFALVVGQIVYFGWFGASAGTVVGHYWMFLIVAWVAVRLGVQGVVLVLLMGGVQGILGTYGGEGMQLGDSARAPQVNFWFFLMLLSTVGVSLAVHFAEHDRLTAELRRAKNRQDAMLDAIPDILFEVGQDGYCYKVHAQDESWLPAASSAMLNRRLQELFPAPAWHIVDAAMTQARLLGVSNGHQLSLNLVQGLCWFDLCVARMDAYGSSADSHFIVLLRDITTRKLAEENLRIAAIAFESEEGIFVANKERRILRVNQAFVTLTGYEPTEVVGMESAVLRSAKHDEALYEKIWDQVCQSGRWQGELWMRRKDGQELVIWGTATAVRGEHNEITHFVRTLTDITHQKFQEQHRLERELALRETLVREVHHRIKNNLQGVTGVLRQFALQHPEIADTINVAISQVQSIAAIHGLQGRNLPGRVALRALVQSVANGVASVWQSSIQVEVLPGLTECWLAQSDAVPLALVLNELLSNAVKHGQGLQQIQVQLGQERKALADRPRVRLLVINPIGPELELAGATLPHSHDPSSGLGLVAALLPPRGAVLSQSIQNAIFTSVLELEEPAIDWENKGVI